MSAFVRKRTIKIDGIKDVSLFPHTPEDQKKLTRLPEGKPVEITMKSSREPDGISKVHSCCELVMANCPEQYDGYWHTKDELYDWLKMSVGWTKIVGSGDVVYRIPRATNFTEEKNEEAVKDGFIFPALQKICEIMGYIDLDELFNASTYWAHHKNDGVHHG